MLHNIETRLIVSNQFIVPVALLLANKPPFILFRIKDPLLCGLSCAKAVFMPSVFTP